MLFRDIRPGIQISGTSTLAPRPSFGCDFGLAGYSGENSAEAAVWPFIKALPKCSAYPLSLSTAPSALAKPNFGLLM